MEEVPATSFPWWQPLPWELFVSSVIKLLCSLPHPLNRTDLPRAPWTKPEYSCLEETFIPWGLLIAHANCPCDSKPHPLSVGF